MPTTIRYRANNSSFGRLMMSDQTQDLANQGARRGVGEARRLATSLGLPAAYVASIKAATGAPKILGGNPRRTAEVQAGFPYLEFGSGVRRDRPQGGNSPAYRVLGRTATLVGEAPRGGN